MAKVWNGVGKHEKEVEEKPKTDMHVDRNYAST